jgi:hypothetical protein
MKPIASKDVVNRTGGIETEDGRTLYGDFKFFEIFIYFKDSMQKLTCVYDKILFYE